MNFIDTHAHIYMEDFNNDLSDMITRTTKANIKSVIIPNVDSKSLPLILNLADKYPSLCKPMMGLHPTSVDANYKIELAEIKTHINNATVAIGEIGIDLYWDKTFLPQQQDAFKTQIEWALEYDLPIAVHARDAFKEIFEILDMYQSERLKGVLHCFTGDKNDAEKILSYDNFLFGIGGVVTFKKSHLPEVLASVIPLQKLVLETDAPYLAPTPYRGKRNEPKYVENIAQKLSEIYNVSLQEVAETTTKNAKLLFNI